jgi:hypothetical protein
VLLEFGAALAAGVDAHPDYPLDGVDLFGESVERNLYWRMVYRNQKAVRRSRPRRSPASRPSRTVTGAA